MTRSPYRYGVAVDFMIRFPSFSSPPRLRRLGTIDSRVKDVGLWFVLTAPILTRPIVTSRPSFGVDVGAAVLAMILLLLRRRLPIPSLMVGLVTAAGSTVMLQRPTVLLPITMVLLFTVAVVCDRRIAIAAGLIVLLAVMICIVTLASRDLLEPLLLAGLAWPTLAVATGSAVRSHREALIAAEERAAWAEATREDEAQRRVIEERLHIARELHDVVAHKIAVVNVQAGVASHLLRSKPDEAANALATIRLSASEVLDELSGLLGVLRAADDGGTTEPVPTIDDIPALIDSFSPLGLHVSLQTLGAPKRVNNATAITAYRAIQEALTNAHKHGDGYATVRMCWEQQALLLGVSNRCALVSRSSSGGFGLTGMRERVTSLGGSVNAAPQPDGTFHVDISLPVSPL
jgi:signal transduction histidine kinase